MWRRLLEWAHAVQRGETRIQKSPIRGRVYRKRAPAEAEELQTAASSLPQASMQLKVTRANGDVEIIDVPRDQITVSPVARRERE
jgi:hypothetical protein